MVFSALLGLGWPVAPASVLTRFGALGLADSSGLLWSVLGRTRRSLGRRFGLAHDGTSGTRLSGLLRLLVRLPTSDSRRFGVRLRPVSTRHFGTHSLTHPLVWTSDSRLTLHGLLRFLVRLRSDFWAVLRVRSDSRRDDSLRLGGLTHRTFLRFSFDRFFWDLSFFVALSVSTRLTVLTHDWDSLFRDSFHTSGGFGVIVWLVFFARGLTFWFFFCDYDFCFFWLCGCVSRLSRLFLWGTFFCSLPLAFLLWFVLTVGLLTGLLFCFMICGVGLWDLSFCLLFVIIGFCETFFYCVWGIFFDYLVLSLCGICCLFWIVFWIDLWLYCFIWFGLLSE